MVMCDFTFANMAGLSCSDVATEAAGITVDLMVKWR